MKATTLIALILGFLMFNSCTKEVLLGTEIADIESYSELEYQSYLSSGEEQQLTVSDNLLANTTIHLQVVSSAFDAVRDELTINFTKDYDFTIEAVATDQYLDVTNTQGTGSRVLVTSESFSESGAVLSIVFDVHGHNLSELSPDQAQSIIVEEVIVN